MLNLKLIAKLRVILDCPRSLTFNPINSNPHLKFDTSIKFVMNFMSRINIFQCVRFLDNLWKIEGKKGFRSLEKNFEYSE